MVKLLFICLGNICRSPSAEGVFRALLLREGLQAHIIVDSAGTAAYHQGEAPDPRAQATAVARGYDLSGQRARQVRPQDCQDFDYLVVMDSANYQAMQQHCPNSSKLMYLLEAAPELGLREVADPYYGGVQGFATMFDHIEQACAALLQQLRQRHSF